MEKWVTRYLVPLLLLVLVIAMYFELRSVETVDLQTDRYEPAITEPHPVRQMPLQQVMPESKSRLSIGERYVSLDELVDDQKAAGFLRTGYFGDHWPAKVTEIQTDNDGIRFIRKDGTPHHYKGFDGYRMKVVRLSDAGEKETIVVFRSVDKR